MAEEEMNRLNLDAETRRRPWSRLSVERIADGKFCLRACIVNHRTKDKDIDAMVQEVLAAAREIAAPKSVASPPSRILLFSFILSG